MNAGEGCRAVALRSNAEAGLLVSANELRLGKPSQNARERFLQSPARRDVAETATAANESRGFLTFCPASYRHSHCVTVRVSADPRFVYILRNADPEPHFYVGLTSDVPARFFDHNAGRCPSTER